LFCGAGGAGMGYHRAGFEVVGVDHRAQPNYPFEFHCEDAFTYLEKHGSEFDVIHASPPCQAYSVASPKTNQYSDLVARTRSAIAEHRKPYVIENVPGAPLHFPITLCGTMFDLWSAQDELYLRRHRLFESSTLLFSLGGCSCYGKVTAQVAGHLDRNNHDCKRHRKPSFENAKRMMGIEWMTKEEIVQAIPPAYTEWIGKQLIPTLEG
jgi:DNA (cytosine-5)-methyltransferase 1